jgi:hypothetical protein
MNVPAPKLGAHQKSLPKRNGDILENGRNNSDSVKVNYTDLRREESAKSPKGEAMCSMSKKQKIVGQKNRFRFERNIVNVSHI